MGTAEVRVRPNTPAASSLGPSPLEERVLEETRARPLEGLTTRDRAAFVVVGGSFLAVALLLLAWLPSSRTPAWWELAFVVVLYAFVSRLEYEVGIGSVVPTQLILTPMLFIFPLGQVPLIVLGGLVLASLVDIGSGKLKRERFGLTAMDAWHTVGPVVVLGLAGEGPPRLGNAPIYALALLSQFAIELASFTARDWITRGVKPRMQLRYMFRSAPIDLALAPLGLAVAFPAQTQPLAILLVLPLIWLLRLLASERRSRIDSALELSEAYRGTAFLLGDVVEADDAYTGLHSRDVVRLSIAVAEQLELDEVALRDTELTALLHDIGKIRVPGEIINKPGALDPAEREIIDTHTVEGEQMLLQIGGLLGSVGHLVRSCHERWDGTGYPDGLVGEAIPLVARIVSCCDAYSAMTTLRPYRQAMSQESAIEELEANAGTQFDPQIATALLGVVARGGVARAF
jgi:HD-GYP domain-containing protein (c-di-GMP phosphodiesterase class II)